MKNKNRFTAAMICIAFFVAAVITFPAASHAGKTRLAFSGGPDGGTFQYFSNAIATRLSKNIENLEVSNMASAGSVENLRRVNSGDADFGIVYSADLYLGLNSGLTNDTRIYDKTYAMAYLYGAPGHLVVLESSGIDMVMDLEGKRVAVGPAGSGAAASAQRYFTSLGLWDKMKVEYIGYSQAASAIGDKLIDAMWIFAGFPNSSVIQAAASNKIRILSVVEEGRESGFFNEFPFYTEIVIPAGTYTGVDYEVLTFQDAAVWVAGKHVKQEVVYSALKDIFSLEGLDYMVSVTKAAKAMGIQDGLTGVVTPVHKGAIQFWTEKELPLTEEQMAD